MGIRIAIQGDIATGKSTLTQYMQSQYDWYAIEYADSLKWALCAAMNFFKEETGTEYDVDDILDDKNTYRRVLQELGTTIGFDRGVGVKRALDNWKLYRFSPNQPTIFDNVRFPAQFEMLKREGFILVELALDENVWVRRVREAGYSTSVFDHTAEKSRPMPDITLNANGTIEEIAERLLLLNGHHITRKAA